MITSWKFNWEMSLILDDINIELAQRNFLEQLKSSHIFFC